ncbi:hypothetical protein CMUS01_02031 [Colletotrichum musicola]|uniref:Uncharacterized protein n=1 Tax=Colletotrichum musicola TaxID=2175873 RepID=A0A8H6NVR5_9PEZI|nr:hypothetical protein CMUS01_02031 [Colletotrichum musicola]
MAWTAWRDSSLPVADSPAGAAHLDEFHWISVFSLMLSARATVGQGQGEGVVSSEGHCRQMGGRFDTWASHLKSTHAEEQTILEVAGGLLLDDGNHFELI